MTCGPCPRTRREFRLTCAVLQQHTRKNHTLRRALGKQTSAGNAACVCQVHITTLKASFQPVVFLQCVSVPGPPKCVEQWPTGLFLTALGPCFGGSGRFGGSNVHHLQHEKILFGRIEGLRLHKPLHQAPNFGQVPPQRLPAQIASASRQIL